MAEVFNASYVTLHVRKSNKAAYHLYHVTLGYAYVKPLPVSCLLAFMCVTAKRKGSFHVALLRVCLLFMHNIHNVIIFTKRVYLFVFLQA